MMLALGFHLANDTFAQELCIVINPLATNATIVALVLKIEITYITRLRILDT